LRVGFIISKRVGGAVLRNRIKRTIREMLRTDEGVLSVRADILFVLRKTVDGIDFKCLKKELKSDLSLFSNK